MCLGSFSECYLLVVDATKRTQAAIFDVDAAFQNIPTHLSAHPFLAIMLKGFIHLDHVLNFGASPSPGIFRRVANAVVKIFLHHRIKAVLKWVNNFIFLHFPTCHKSDGTFVFKYSADLIWSIAEELGWPWAPEKFADFSTSFTYIGFLWDLTSKWVQVASKEENEISRAYFNMDS